MESDIKDAGRKEEKRHRCQEVLRGNKIWKNLLQISKNRCVMIGKEARNGDETLGVKKYVNLVIVGKG